MEGRPAATETTPRYRVGDFLLAIEALAILRGARRQDFARLARRRVEVGEVLAGYGEPPLASPLDGPELDLQDGYTVWSATYDPAAELNPVMALESAVMRQLIDALPPGPILDAGCGTGRHTAYLVETGHDVIGVDANAGMLEQARMRLPGVDFRQGDFASLPVGDASVAAVVCGLALGHLHDLSPGVAELCRVVRPGGRIAISWPHPFLRGALGRRTPVIDAEGNPWVVPDYEHWHGEYIEAFRRAGLEVLQCIEPRVTAELSRQWNPLSQEAGADRFDDAFADALVDLPAVLVWETKKPG